LQAFNPCFDHDFYDQLTLGSVLAIHDVPGGTAPARVQQALSVAEQRIKSLREEAHAHA
jgi:argininosuccinate lyase